MENDPTLLDPNVILSAEYDYIVQTAMQANEDRARVSNYYLAAAGAAVAAIIGAGFDAPAPPGIHAGFGLLFAGLGIIGILTLLQLARLRRAWRDSVMAMNTLKEYYIAHFAELGIEKAFAWRFATIPPGGKRTSLAYLLALSVVLIASASLSTAFIYLCLALNLLLIAQILGAGLIFVLAALFQVRTYEQWVR